MSGIGRGPLKFALSITLALLGCSPSFAQDILLSSILNYGIEQSGDDQSSLSYLPSYADTAWASVGVSASGLRVFVDRTSIKDVEGLRQVRVRLGSPRVITGTIVEVRQDEEFDCAGNRWRLRGYVALDEADKVVARSLPSAKPGALLAIDDGAINGAVRDFICPQAAAH